MVKRKKTFYFANYGFSRKDFQKWGKLGGRPKKICLRGGKTKSLSSQKSFSENR